MSEWELVQTTGRGPGKISHHTVSVRPTKEVIFYGGLRGDDSNDEVFLFNPNTNTWSIVQPSVSNCLPFGHRHPEKQSAIFKARLCWQADALPLRDRLL